MSLNVQIRALNGRFLAKGQKDPKAEEIRESRERENRRALIYIELCKKLGVDHEKLGIKQFPETGNWIIDFKAGIFLTGACFGIMFGTKKETTPEKAMAIAKLWREANKYI